MATIEPRLMHLLNDPKSTHLPPPDLPPLQAYALPKSSSRPVSLPPLDLDDGHGSEQSAPIAQLVTQKIPPILPLDEDGPSRTQPQAHDIEFPKERSRQSVHPLRMLLDDPEINESTHSLRHILGDTAPEITDDASTKKRHRALTVKEDFVQLPQPLKKQKSSQQVVPPIINGLHEPPPNAGVFPPISSGTFDDTEARTVNILKDFSSAGEDRAASGTPAEVDKATSAKLKRRTAKPRRKWSEEETTHLLLGVSRHGVGKWTSILEDPDFRFNDRTAGDLKDRFRTCCPDELRGATGAKGSAADKPGPITEGHKLRKKGALQLENILIDPEEPSEREQPTTPQVDSDSVPKQKKSRAHRKNIEDLESLGIRGPFKKSHRRERRPFTEEDDKAILEGLDQYGPAWTKIQRDPRYQLSSRQPTDLRDRVRNKYPDIYARIEKGSFQIKDPPRGNSLLEPSVNTTIENSLISTKPGHFEPQLNRTTSKEDMPKLPHSSSFLEATDYFGTLQAMEPEPSASYLIGGVGEMDISRLLLDDSQLSSDN